MAGYTPSVLEFMERKAIDISQQNIGQDFLKLEEETEAALLIEVDGTEEEFLFKKLEGIFEVLKGFKTGEILFADQDLHKEKLWKIRTVMGEAAKTSSIYRSEERRVGKELKSQ